MSKIVMCRKVRVNQGGYAYSGRHYFGTGVPLYYVECENGRSDHVRAFSRDAAIKLFESNRRSACCEE